MTLRGLLTRTLLLLPALALAGAGMPGRAAAQPFPQATANVQASAFVAPPPILLTSTRDLYFGMVTQGQTVSVPAQPPYTLGTWSAGVRFSNLRKNRNYAVYFVLPAQITNGTFSMPVSFNGAGYGWVCVFTIDPSVCDAGQSAFNPSLHSSSGTAVVLDIPNNSPGNNFFADFYVGGQLTVPGGALVPGSYTAPLTVNIALIN